MENRMDIVQSLAGQLVNNIPDRKNLISTRTFKFLLALLGIILFTGAEAAQVIFRKNFGRRIINLPLLILACASFLGISVISFDLAFHNQQFELNNASSDVHFASGIIFSVLAFTILINGISGYIKARKNTGLPFEYPGDSYLLDFLSKNPWWNQNNRIRNIAEPLCTMAVGIIYGLFDIVAGAAILACSVSMWGRSLFEIALLQNRVQRDINAQKQQHTEPIRKFAKPADS